MSPKLSQLLRMVFAFAATLVVLSVGASAQTETILHNFAGRIDGWAPDGLTLAANGTLYGTTSGGGEQGRGTVFRLTPTSIGWTKDVLYNFAGGEDGESPQGNLIIDASGNIFGTTWAGGLPGYCFYNSCGTVFELSPTSMGWIHTVLYKFRNRTDGGQPNVGLAVDAAGNLYGTTSSGGDPNCYGIGCGVVWKLSRATNGQWNETVLHAFASGLDGSYPNRVVVDAAGTVFGIASDGGAYRYGTSFKISPSTNGPKMTMIYQFTGKADGGFPAGGLALDSKGNLYGATSFGGETHFFGTVFQLSPTISGSWQLTPLRTLGPINGEFPVSIALGADGNLYGSTEFGGSASEGVVWGLSPTSEGWKQTLLYDFTGINGGFGGAAITADSAGNVFGVAFEGGAYGFGVVYMITP